jgi:hypothetical protein
LAWQPHEKSMSLGRQHGPQQHGPRRNRATEQAAGPG